MILLSSRSRQITSLANNIIVSRLPLDHPRQRPVERPKRQPEEATQLSLGRPLNNLACNVSHCKLNEQHIRLISTSRSKKLERILRTRRIMSYRYDDDEISLFEPNITHGESVVDRKSVFQGHSAYIGRVEHVDIVLDKLKENKKIENAFHNMWAYRIDKSDPTARLAGKSAAIVQDCDDDGEQAAGGRLLTLLQILNLVNVMVVVTRWYGGIQLGPARFKHINNAARDSLVKGGFVSDGSGGAKEVEGDGSGSSGHTKHKGSGKSRSKKKGK